MWSRISYFCSVALLLYASLIYDVKWNNAATESPLGWDAASYYWYLPATFIYKDLKQQKFGDSIIAKYGFTPDFSQSYPYKGGNRVIGYSSGVAVLQLPAFLIAHVLAEPLGYPADGFSKPYLVAIQLWGVFAGLLGLWFFRRLLLLYFDDRVTAIVLLMLVFGTNYLNYAAIDVTITHSYLFTIYVLLLLNTHYFYKHPQRKYAVRIGLLTGLAILVRPSEMVAVIIPLLWGMQSLSVTALRKHIAFLKKHSGYVLLSVLCVVIVGSVQVVYWYYVTGSPLVYSYDDKTFSWLSPHTWPYLTDSTSGWLMYNPMILFIFIGLIPFVRYGRNRVAILSFFIVNLYVVSAWDIWWYSGIGGRAMIQSYAVLFFIAATFIQYLFEKKWRIMVATPFLLLFLYTNLWVVYNAHCADSLYDVRYMSPQYYRAVVGRWHVDKEVIKLQDAKDIYRGKMIDKVLLYHNDFENETDTFPGETIAGGRSLYAKAHFNSRVYKVPYTVKNKEWVRLQCTYKCFRLEWNYWSMFRTRLHFVKDGNEVKGEDYRPQRFLWDMGVRTIYYDIKVPDQPFDTIEISFINENSDQELLIDDMSVWAYNGE